MFAVLKAVSEAPPPRFSGGGYWEAMHDEMAGYYEVRVDGPKRRHYRLFCVLERAGDAVGARRTVDRDHYRHGQGVPHDVLEARLRCRSPTRGRVPQADAP
jgi:hypothetical protein